jgi:hypothetical protein
MGALKHFHDGTAPKPQPLSGIFIRSKEWPPRMDVKTILALWNCLA